MAVYFYFEDFYVGNCPSNSSKYTDLHLKATKENFGCSC